MEERNERKQTSCPVGTPRCGLLFALLGAVAAIMLLFLGFWRTLFIALLAFVGYFLGAYTNKAELIKTCINRIFPPKSE